jgi:hypothetical protein
MIEKLIAFMTRGGRIVVHKATIPTTNGEGQQVEIPNPVVTKMQNRKEEYTLATYDQVLEYVETYNKDENHPKKIELDELLKKLGMVKATTVEAKPKEENTKVETKPKADK